MNTASIPIHYEHDKAIICFSQQVDSASILTLCEEIDTAVDYYDYKKIQIKIESPGGAIDALQFYVDKLKQWRRKGIRFETMALMQSCSAAALMLSLGDLGRRCVAPSANLLYHNARIFDTSQPLTSDHLGELERRLSQIDDKILLELLRHLYSGLDDRCFAFVESYKSVLSNDSRELDTSSLRLLPGLSQSLKDYDNSVARSKPSREILRGKIDAKLPNLDKEAPKLLEAATLAEFQQTLACHGTKKKIPLTLSWLSYRFESYRQLFSADKLISPADAQEKNLIDTIEE